MKKYLILVIGLVLIGILQGTTITVDIEGNGDYISIQEGIDASEDGDIVLVYPGRYFENIDFIGKEITVASLEMTTGNRDYIHSTVIDGNQNSCCVAVHNEEGSDTILRGFTITNGIGYPDPYGRYGGGIYSYETSFCLINCIIEQNSGIIGGGIYIDGGDVCLEGNTFRYNSAYLQGGGIYSCYMTSSLLFSEVNRNNIYYNNAVTGNDIFNSLEYNGIPIDVVVDTFTVTEPFSYEFYQGENNYDNQNYDILFDMLHPMRERIYSDVYISPVGDDENCGITPDEPLQTLNQALHFITASEDHPLSIYLAEGIYSTELNNQIFPIILRSHVSIIGESVENTIIELDGNGQGFANDFISELNYEIKNLTIMNGYENMMTLPFNRIFHNNNYSHSLNQVLFENLRLIDNQCIKIIYLSSMNMKMKNMLFENNIKYPSFAFLHSLMHNHIPDCRITMEGCRIINNQNGNLHLTAATNNSGDHIFDIINCEIGDNNYFNNFTDYSVGISLSCTDDQKINIVNSTFAGNVFDGMYVVNAPIRLAYDIDAEIINTIIYDNETEYSIILRGNYTNGIPVLNVHHSMIEGGYDSVYFDGIGVLNWDEETISDSDPLFLYEGEYPYKLQESSPAIDAGSLDLPEGVVLPEYDLAGNLRIRGNGIDIGAYEYNPYSNPVNENELEYTNLVIYPNPVHVKQGRGSVIINYPVSRDESGYELSIYNIKGQRLRKFKIENVKCKINSGTRNSKLGIGNLVWDLRNEAGQMVSSGVYFLRISLDGEFIEQGKLTVIK